MKKRADGLYQYQLYLGKDINGKRKYKTFYGKTQKEAKQKGDEYKQGEAAPRADFSSVASRYLALEYQRISLSQYKTKCSRIEYFAENFGSADIKNILPENIQTLINRLAVNNPSTHRPTAKRTLARYLDALNNVFEFAQKNRMISVNPCDFVYINTDAPKKERTTLTEEERKKIENCGYDRAWIAVFLMYTGLRVGEATALTWKDIDLQNKTINIDKSYNFKEYEVKSPKTKAGYRIVPIPDKIIPILRDHKKGKYVIQTTEGNQMRHASWKRLRLHITKETGVEFEWHQLRHTYASVLYSAGVDVLTACKLLGHSDVRTTMGIYTHLEESKKQLSIDKLNDFLA